MARTLWILGVVALISTLTSCASVDQFGGRVVDGNLNSQDALNQEILLNIIRASRYQSINFVGLSQISGGQTEQLTTGLPTALFGNVATAAQVYSLSNSVQSSVTGGYQASPLITTPFQSGMLAPVNLKTVSWLIGSHPRSIVLFALIQSFRIKGINNGLVVSLANDPDIDNDTQENCDKIATKIYPADDCTYTKFANLLNALQGYGLTVELRPGDTPKPSTSPPASATANTSGSSTGTSTPNMEGHLCFEPSLASTTHQAAVASGRYLPLCGQTAESNKGAARSVRFDYLGTGPIEIEVSIRSPQQYFNYLGEWARGDTSRDFPHYYSDAADRVKGNQRYVEIENSKDVPCYAAVKYAGQFYCVPQSALHTAMLMDIAEALRNLNISPSDLNSAFTVRLTP